MHWAWLRQRHRRGLLRGGWPTCHGGNGVRLAKWWVFIMYYILYYYINYYIYYYSHGGWRSMVAWWLVHGFWGLLVLLVICLFCEATAQKNLLCHVPLHAATFCLLSVAQSLVSLVDRFLLRAKMCQDTSTNSRPGIPWKWFIYCKYL